MLCKIEYYSHLTFKDGCGLQDLLLYPGVLTTDGCKELQNQLCTLGLPSSRLTTITQRDQCVLVQLTNMIAELPIELKEQQHTAVTVRVLL